MVHFRVARDVGAAEPRSFDAASNHVTEDDVAELVPCGPDTARHVQAVRKFVEAG